MSLVSGESYNGARGHDVDLREVVDSLLYSKWWILLCVTCSLAATSIFLFFSTSIYEADALIQVEADKPPLSGLSGLTEVLPAESAISAELEIVRSRKVLGEVVRNLGLNVVVERKDIGALAGKYFGVDSRNESIEVRRFEYSNPRKRLELTLEVTGPDSFVINHQGNKIAHGRSGEHIAMSFDGGKETGSLNIREFQLARGAEFDLSYVPDVAAIAHLRSRLDVREVGRDTGIMRLSIVGKDPDKLEDVLNSISNVYLKQNVERRSAEAQQSLSFLNQQLPAVRTDLELAENKLAAFRAANQTIDLTIETESVLQKMVLLDRQISELELRRAELTRNYTPDHPVVQTIDEQRNQLLDQKRQLETSSSELPDVQQELLRYMREVEVSTELYTFMLNKIQELRVVEAGTVGNVRVLDEAAASVDPVSPRHVYYLVGAFFFSLVFSIAWLLAEKFLRRGVTDPDEIERVLGTPVYGVLPLCSENEMSLQHTEEAPIASAAKNSIIAESFRSLRTSIHFALGASQSGSVIAISGPSPSVGKTFISSNLAAILADSGSSVLYVDCDLRRGNADTVFSLPRSPGLSNLLSNVGQKFVHKCAFSENLAVITRGKSPPNPAELFIGERFSMLIEEWRIEYDLVILDTPPVLAVTDPVLISKHADALFLVGRVGQNSMSELVEAKARFNRGGVDLTGLVVNGMTGKLAVGTRYGAGNYDYEYASLDD